MLMQLLLFPVEVLVFVGIFYFFDVRPGMQQMRTERKREEERERRRERKNYSSSDS